MFRNLIVYRLGPWAFDAGAKGLIQAITPQAFAPCGSLDDSAQGWVPPVEGGELAHVVNKQIILHLKSEKKLLPNSVINDVTRAKCRELEEQQGFKPGKKQTREIKEQVVDELLPRAFSTSSIMRVWLDPVNGWLAMDTASQSRAEDALRLLIKAIDKFPVESSRVKQSPAAAMTTWLEVDESPVNFTVDTDAELRARGEGKATVKYVRHALESNHMQRHIAEGKQCVALAMTWADRVSFVLTDSLVLKRVEMLDILKESGDEPKDARERFDADVALMTGEFNKMLTDLVEALGGEIRD